MMVNKTLDGKYTLIGLREKGDIFQSYLAHYHLLGTQVMVDLIYPHRMKSAMTNLVDLFERGRCIKSDHISRIYTWGQEEECFYVVYEYSHGTLLRDLLGESGDLPVSQSLQILRDIIGGMAAAHGKGIYFLGVNPHQVWVERTGQARLLRPGYSFILEREDNRLSRMLSVYWPPEVLRGEEGTRSSDIFSLGVICRELLSTCFENTILRDICLNACSYDPANRPSSAKVFLERIEGALSGQLQRRGGRLSEGELAEGTAGQSELDGHREGGASQPSSQERFSGEHLDLFGTASMSYARELIDGQPLWKLRGQEGPGDFSPMSFGQDNQGYISAESPTARNLPYDISPPRSCGQEGPGDFSPMSFGHLINHRDRPSGISLEQEGAGAISRIAEGPLATHSGKRRTRKVSRLVKTLFLVLAIVLLCFIGIRLISSSPKLGITERSETSSPPTLVDGRKICMPDLCGLDSKEARRLMGEMGFSVEILEEPSNVIPEGKIILQEPEKGKPLEAGGRIKFYVSTGPLQQKFSPP